MPRRLSDELNELKIYDSLSGCEIVLYYRTPTTQETVRYNNELVTRKRNKLVTRFGETRQKYGAAILEGFREGDFEKKADGEYVPIASDPESEHFDPNWKELVQSKAPDLVGLLGRCVFESAAEDEHEREESEESEDAEQD